MPAPRLPDPPPSALPPPPLPGAPAPPVEAEGLLPPPPDEGGRLPEWIDDLRRRAGLDHRAVVWVAVAVVAAGVAAWLLRPAPAPLEEALPMASSSAAEGGGGGASDPSAGGAAPTSPGSDDATSTTEPPEVVVHAAGAVRTPGVYPLPGGARVDDLVDAAGGLAPDADAARLNLAAPLADGARVYVPRVGEAELPEVVDADGGTAGGAGQGGADGAAPGAADDGAVALIDLNTATADELEALPGVGPAIAAAIVAFREENGGFATVDDLLDVRGIGEARLADIRPLVTV